MNYDTQIGDGFWEYLGTYHMGQPANLANCGAWQERSFKNTHLSRVLAGQMWWKTPIALCSYQKTHSKGHLKIQKVGTSQLKMDHESELAVSTKNRALVFGSKICRIATGGLAWTTSGSVLFFLFQLLW